MSNLIQHILNKDFDSARTALNEAMGDIIEHKLTEMKQGIDLTEAHSREQLSQAAASHDKISGNLRSVAKRIEPGRLKAAARELGGGLDGRRAGIQKNRAERHEAENTRRQADQHDRASNVAWELKRRKDNPSVEPKKWTELGKVRPKSKLGWDRGDRRMDEGWYKKTLDSASKKSDKEGNWDFKKGDYTEKGKSELTTGEKIVDKVDNAKIAIGKKFRHAVNKLTKEETIEEGRHKGIGNKKKKGRLAAQTRDLRNTFGVAPGKVRRAGPRASLEEDIRNFVRNMKAAGKSAAHDLSSTGTIGKEFGPAAKVAKDAIKNVAGKVGKKIAKYNDDHPNFGMVSGDKRINENYWKEKQLKAQDNDDSPPFKPDPKGAEKHSSASLARRAMKAAKKAKEKKLEESTPQYRGVPARVQDKRKTSKLNQKRSPYDELEHPDTPKRYKKKYGVLKAKSKLNQKRSPYDELEHKDTPAKDKNKKLEEALHRTVRSRGLGARGGKSLLSPLKGPKKDTRKDEAAWRKSISDAQDKDDDPKTMREGKWDYPKEMTKTKETSDMGTTNAARNREDRKALRKKIKAKAHKALMSGKKD